MSLGPRYNIFTDSRGITNPTGSTNKNETLIKSKTIQSFNSSNIQDIINNGNNCNVMHIQSSDNLKNIECFTNKRSNSIKINMIFLIIIYILLKLL